MKSSWKQKRLLVLKFNGEDRHLAWNRSVYQEWFRFAQISPLKTPKEFGFLQEFGIKNQFIYNNEGKIVNPHKRDYFHITKKAKEKGEEKIYGRPFKEADKEFKKWWELNKELFLELREKKSIEILDKDQRIKTNDTDIFSE